MIPVSSSYNLQGMSTLNFNNLLASTNQTQATLPISALGNILQLHCNPSLTLQVNGPSPLIPVSTKDTNGQEQLNTFRNMFPNQQSYQNITQQDQPQIQCTNTSPRGFHQLIQDLLSTYQTQQDSLSQLTIKYNFLLNAMERLLFDVQNNVEYSLLALGISQTISKVKLNQLNQLNQLNCAPLISNGIIPLINQSHLFNNCTQQSSIQHNDTINIPSIIDLTNQRTRSNSMTAISLDKKSETSQSESNMSTNTNNSKPMKMTSLDKLDKLIDETVKKSTGKSPITEDNAKLLTPQEENHQSSVIDVNLNMGNAIHQIIRQFYQNASLSMTTNNNGLVGHNTLESSFPNVQHAVARLQADNLKSATNSFSQQVTEIIANSQIPFNGLANQSNQSFILCNNLPTNSIIKGQHREPFVVSLNNSCKENNAPIAVASVAAAENLHENNNNTTEDTESTSNHEEDDMCFSELDPTEVATRIRDILSLHSIGQRLFAKHVLNLSQGTVSELLSKPKPWSKLSEKGRDSYRKMNQWAQDSSKVQELKSIAPRKGFSGHYAGMSPATPIKEDHETQEKIKRILNDAKMAMASTNIQSTADEEIFSCYVKPSESIVNGMRNDGPKVTTVVCNSIQSVPNSAPNILEFDISQLQKKFVAALHSTSVPNISRHDASMQQFSATTATSTAATTTYQQSPVILMNLANIIPCSSSLVSAIQPTHSSVLPIVSTKIIQPDSEKYCIRKELISNKATLINKAETITVKTEADNGDDAIIMVDKSYEETSDTKACAEQLEDLKNNSSKSSTELENLENFLKSFIGSIKLTENCFQNEEINTTELVNVIKDHLTKNSISQRTFGCLLGLSQGTISDILSRPKPWSLLTNKGREPYIRMLKYLLKPTYFKVIENCSNTTSLSHTSLIESLPNSDLSPSSSEPALTYDQNMIYDDKHHVYNLQISQHPEPDECNGSSSTEGRDYQSWDDDIPNINIDAYGSPITNLEKLDTENIKYDDPKERIFNISTRIVTMDTVSLTNNVKEILSNNNLGQRVFGEFILNLSQASVSDLLSKPKSWNQLSLKGREPYVRMYLWLRQRDKLQVLNKMINIKKDVSSVKENDDNDSMLATNSFDDSKLERKLNSKRTRVIFTDEQKTNLKDVFDKCHYPKPDQLVDFSKRLNLTVATVSNWFHNQRIRLRSQGEQSQQHNQPSVVNKIESLSGESEMNSEKSLPMNIDDIFDASDSDNSISAPHLYPESNLQEFSSSERIEDDDGSGNYFAGSAHCTTVAGSNKRKRTNPIKLEMVLNKASIKDGDEYEKEPLQGENIFSIKVQKIDQHSL